MEPINQRDVSTAPDLFVAARDGDVNRIVVSGEVAGLPSLDLSPGQALTAVAFSVQPEGWVRRLRIAGGLITHGAGAAPFELQGGVEPLEMKGEAVTLGRENEISH